MTITWNALKEKVRRKELYIVAAIGVLVIVMFSSGAGTLSFDGVPITDFKMLAPILLVVVNVVCGILAIVLSLKTIPNEYERHTSHLIWIRGISQSKYHMQLALANILGSMLATGILYIGVGIFSIIKGESKMLLYILPSYLIMCISVSIVSLMTSLLTIVLPTMAAGCVVTILFLIGISSSIVSVYVNMVSGLVSNILKVILAILPDLNGIQAQASNLLRGGNMDLHIILKGCFTIYILTMLFSLFKRKEA